MRYIWKLVDLPKTQKYKYFKNKTLFYIKFYIKDYIMLKNNFLVEVTY